MNDFYQQPTTPFNEAEAKDSIMGLRKSRVVFDWEITMGCAQERPRGASDL